MALKCKKVRVATGHYVYRGYEVEKHKAKWYLSLNNEKKFISTTLIKCCEVVDKALLNNGSDTEVIEVKASTEPKTTKKDKTTLIDPSLATLESKFKIDLVVCKEIETIIIDTLNIGVPTSVVSGVVNYSLRWDDFNSDIDVVSNNLMLIMTDYPTLAISINFSKNLLFLSIGQSFNNLSVKDYSQTTEDKFKDPKKIETNYGFDTEPKELSIDVIKCDDVCKVLSEKLFLENPLVSYNNHSCKYIFSDYKGDKDTDIQTIRDISGDFPMFDINMYISLTVCYISVSLG